MPPNDTETTEFVVCPSCHAVNALGAVVCAACGVNLAQFQAARERLRETLDGQLADHTEQLSQHEQEAAADSATHSRAQTRRLLKGLLVASLILAVAVAALSAFYGHQRRLRRERLEQDYQAAWDCLESGDYVCARDGFVAVLHTAPGYGDAQDGLNRARYGLAWQLMEQKAWSAALKEVSRLLHDAPDDASALALQDEIYSRWLEDAREKGHWLTVLQLLMKRPAD